MQEEEPAEAAVVRPHYAIEEAYQLGYQEFDGMVDSDDPEEFDLSGFKQSARWSNNLLPLLRAMAGYGDRGHGTHQVERRVAAVRPGCEEDKPAPADLVDASHVHEKLVEAFDQGAYDAARGYEQDCEVYW